MYFPIKNSIYTQTKMFLRNASMMETLSFRPARKLVRGLHIAILLLCFFALFETRDGLYAGGAIVLFSIMIFLYLIEILVDEFQWARVINRMGDRIYDYPLLRYRSTNDTLSDELVDDLMKPARKFHATVEDWDTEYVPQRQLECVDVERHKESSDMIDTFARLSVYIGAKIIWLCGARTENEQKISASNLYRDIWTDLLHDSTSTADKLTFSFDVICEACKIVVLDAPLSRFLARRVFMRDNKSASKCARPDCVCRKHDD